jgi:hypothetical protein
LFYRTALKTRNLYTSRIPKYTRSARNTRLSHTASHTGVENKVIEHDEAVEICPAEDWDICSEQNLKQALEYLGDRRVARVVRPTRRAEPHPGPRTASNITTDYGNHSGRCRPRNRGMSTPDADAPQGTCTGRIIGRPIRGLWRVTATKKSNRLIFTRQTLYEKPL